MSDPVAYVAGFNGGRPIIKLIDKSLVLQVGTALYPKPQPLTNNDIINLWNDHLVSLFEGSRQGINPIVFARAIEKTHGVG